MTFDLARQGARRSAEARRHHSVRPSRAQRQDAPLFLTCIDAADDKVEVVARLSFGCEQKEIGLAREVIAV